MPVGDAAQQQVTGRVAERVVDHLEAVQVDEERGDTAGGAAAKAPSIRVRNSARLASPVSESWKAWFIASSVFASVTARLTCSANALRMSWDGLVPLAGRRRTCRPTRLPTTTPFSCTGTAITAFMSARTTSGTAIGELP